ncbi:SDR family oxidoreductase [Actinoplanes sp. CA-051413]|uniref:SDR family oxidoreductase n=1 Tax=Actinoplanes sp. CA-051413 TaxID=3239899 RepID=UPI003D95FF70
MTEQTIALVTGANKGIGYEIVAQLAERGMTVFLGARDEQRRERAVAALRDAGHVDVHPIALDVTDPATARAAAATVEERFGRLDVLVNNAGISGGLTQAPSSVDPAVFRAVFDVNVIGVLTVTNAMLPLLRRSGAPRIVNMSSGVGSLAAMSDPDGFLAQMPPSAAYVPSKTALNSLTVQYAKELRKEGVLVNAADPGWVATDFTDHRAPRTPQQGAAIVVRLATLGSDGPTGGFFNDEGPVPW